MLRTIINWIEQRIRFSTLFFEAYKCKRIVRLHLSRRATHGKITAKSIQFPTAIPDTGNCQSPRLAESARPFQKHSTQLCSTPGLGDGAVMCGHRVVHFPPKPHLKRFNSSAPLTWCPKNFSSVETTCAENRRVCQRRAHRITFMNYRIDRV